MGYKENRERLDRIYRKIQEECDLPKYLMSDFHTDWGQLVQIAFLEVSTELVVDPVEIVEFNEEALIGLVKCRLVDSLVDIRNLVDENIEKLGV